MGRTRPPFSQRIDQERRAWTPCARALRKADQAAVDRLFDGAKLHGQAGVSLACPWPFEVTAMAMLLEQQMRPERVLAPLEGAGVRWSGEARDARGPGVSPESPFGSQGVRGRGGGDADVQRNEC